MKYLKVLYALLFAHKPLYKLNRFFYHLSLRGMGVLNHPYLTGEDYMIKYINKKYDINVLFDVGAAKGDYTQKFLNFNNSIKAYCFEPHPITVQKLKDRYNDYENVCCVGKGVSNTLEKMELYDYKNKQGSAHASVYKDVMSTKINFLLFI
jgi:hypothetical protein